MRKVTLDWVRESMLEGMRIVTSAVSKTMGPSGRNVVIEEWGVPTFTNDGVTVARAITLPDPIENIGAHMIKEACEKTNKQAWDWTTTTAVLTYAIAYEWLRHITEWLNPFLLSKALRDVGENIIAVVKSQGKQVETREETEQVATISAQDPEIGKLIADIMDEVGEDWTIVVEEWQTNTITHEIKRWLQFDTGIMSPYMENKDNGSYEDTTVPVLVTDIHIDSIKQIKGIGKIMDQLAQKDIRKLVIICNEIDEELMKYLILLRIPSPKNPQPFICNVIKAPGFGPIMKELLHDIAVVTGSAFIAHWLDMKLEELEPSALGLVEKITSTTKKTIITQWPDREEAITARVEVIKKSMEWITDTWQLAKYQERISKLAWGIGIIRVGASTHMEMQQKKFKIEDALNATKSAIEEWIVDGWGMALINTHFIDDSPKDPYRTIAKEILKQAIEYPFWNICTNAWYKPEAIQKAIPIGQGFNAKTGEYCDMMESGIIDPIKVIRVALENAISSATMLLTTEATITTLPDTK